MPEATDIQMQTFGDGRIRQAAEDGLDFATRLAQDKAQIGDIYARAVSANAWADSRDDGPPVLLQSGNSANPDHMLVYNTIATIFAKFVDGTATSQDVADFSANWPVFTGCAVRSVVE